MRSNVAAPLAVVIPVLNEAPHLPRLLARLQAASTLVAEVVVVDGGSHDASRRIAALHNGLVLQQSGGRGAQLAAGVAVTSAPWLLLLHGDAVLPDDWAGQVQRRLAKQSRHGRPEAYYFELAIDAAAPALRLVELAVHLRSRWRQQPYGDQGLLLPSSLLQACGGVHPLPLMEDLELVLRLRRGARLRSLGTSLRVDGRRWRRLGVWGTTLANARLRRAWRRGARPEELVRLYYGSPAAQAAYQNAQRRCWGSSSQPWAS